MDITLFKSQYTNTNHELWTMYYSYRDVQFLHIQIDFKNSKIISKVTNGQILIYDNNEI